MGDGLTSSMDFSISLKRGARFYLAIFLVLLALNLVAILLMNVDDFPGKQQLVRFFHFDREDNAPTLYSVFLLLQASVVCLVISRSNIHDQKYWLSLSAIFAFLSLDEFASIHERLGLPIRDAFSISGFFHFTWIIPGAIFVLIVGILFLGWLRRLPKQTRVGFVLSALLFLSGALLLEGFGGWRSSIFGGDELIYNLIATAEESLEMLGTIAFTYIAVKFLLSISDNNELEVRIVDVQRY